MSEERDLLLQQGLSRKVEVLGRYWSCPEPRCPRHRPEPQRHDLFLREGTHLFLHRAARPFTIGDRAQVHPSLEITRSGRRYPSELAAQRRTPRHPPPSEPPSTVSYWNPP